MDDLRRELNEMETKLDRCLISHFVDSSCSSNVEVPCPYCHPRDERGFLDEKTAFSNDEDVKVRSVMTRIHTHTHNIYLQYINEKTVQCDRCKRMIKGRIFGDVERINGIRVAELEKAVLSQIDETETKIKYEKKISNSKEYFL